jgi:nitrous oxide reductase accessory protein NosL
MKQGFVAGIFALLLFCFSGMGVLAQTDDIEDHRDCIHCGMDRKAYGFSRMLVSYEDGAAAGVCSLHCAVRELDANQRRKVKAILVADRESRTLIDAEKAIWVMGGKKRGVMTQLPKWAFQTKAAAEAFIREYGGTIASWAEALAAAREGSVPESQ